MIHSISNTPEDCIRFAREFEDPADACLRIILSHGTFIDLCEYEFRTDNPFGARMIELFHRAYAKSYVFTDGDIALLLEHIAPYLAAEWEQGEKAAREGRFDTLRTDDVLDECGSDDAEPVPVLLLQNYTGDHIECPNGIFNWYLDPPDAETDFYNTILEYRRLDSLDPRIVDILVAPPPIM